MKNTGEAFEKAIEDIFNAIYRNHPQAIIKRNVMLNGPDGTRQFDVVITVKVLNEEFITVIEGKDYNTKIKIEKIDGFHSKMNDVNASKGIIISKLGFTSKAISKAKRLGIVLYSLQHHPEIKEVDLKIPVLIEEISPFKIDMFFVLQTESIKRLKSNFSYKKNLVVNNRNLFEIINQGWLDGSLKLGSTKEFQTVKVPSISPPYIIECYLNNDLKKPINIEAEDINLNIKIQSKYYLCDVRDIINDSSLKNILQERIYIFLNAKHLVEKLKNLEEVSAYYAQNFTGIQYSIKVRGNWTLNSTQK